jgi:uncharacterized membrane protein HdeD (DUF308 family)
MMNGLADCAAQQQVPDAAAAIVLPFVFGFLFLILGVPELVDIVKMKYAKWKAARS